ncbi:DNA methyl transferase1 [Zea mays]|uniref:DNA methyl transferase1 n=1 Tax=Zea mays TaxID=4577 RepID=A0A1D6HU53_MAIZE|nr:DNA methyl transferase1 [Zea mays]
MVKTPRSPVTTGW